MREVSFVVKSEKLPAKDCCATFYVYKNSQQYGTVDVNVRALTSSTQAVYKDSAGTANDTYVFKLATSTCDCEGTESGTVLSCEGNVTLHLVFLQNFSVHNGTATLVLTVVNSNSAPVNFNLQKLLLPAGISGDVLVPSTEIPGNASLSFKFQLDTQNATPNKVNLLVEVPAGAGTYLCGNTRYSAGGAAANLQIGSITGGSGASCDLRVEEFSFSPSSSENGKPVKLCITLKNYGSMPVTNVVVPAIVLPTELASATNTASSIGILAVGEKKQVCLDCTIQTTAANGVVNVSYPSNTITADCGNVIGNVSANLEINSKAVTAKFGHSQLPEQSTTGACAFGFLEGGVPGATYSITTAYSTQGPTTADYVANASGYIEVINSGAPAGTVVSLSAAGITTYSFTVLPCPQPAQP